MSSHTVPSHGLKSGVWKGALFSKPSSTGFIPVQKQTVSQNTDISPISFPIGFTALTEHDTTGNDVHVKWYADNYSLTTVDIHQDSSGTSFVDDGSVSWFAIAHNDRDFQTGTSSFTAVGSQTVTFGTGLDFHSTPNVVVWLSGFDLSTVALGGWGLSTTVSNITQQGFTVALSTNSRTDTTVSSATVTWIAYPAKRANIGSGSFKTTSTATRTGTLGLTPGFDVAPNVLVGFDAFNVGNSQGKFDISVAVSNVTQTSLTWKFAGDAVSVLNSASATYLAIQNY